MRQILFGTLNWNIKHKTMARAVLFIVQRAQASGLVMTVMHAIMLFLVCY